MNEYRREGGNKYALSKTCPSSCPKWMAQPMIQRSKIVKRYSPEYPPNSTFIADGIDYSGYFATPGNAVDFSHKNGYNFVRLDGSASWLEDSKRTIAGLLVPRNNFVVQEAAFVNNFDKQ